VTLKVPPDEVGAFRIFVKAPLEALTAKQTSYDLVLTDLATRETVVHRAIFNGPEH
jgi:hypothetical protein